MYKERETMENSSQKKILIILAILFISSTNVSAQIDTRTQNKIKAKFLTAQELYDENNYSASLEKVYEIEKLTNGQILAAAQNLKVKCLVGQKKYTKAKDELYTLEGLNLSNDILKDISSYSQRIEKFVKAEEAKNQAFKDKIRPQIDEWDYNEYWVKHDKALVKIESNGKFGYVNKNLELVIPFKYERGDDVSKDGYIVTSLGSKDQDKYDWSTTGVINLEGKVIIPHKYNYIRNKGKGYFKTNLKNKTGVLNKDNDVVVPFLYNDIRIGFRGEISFSIKLGRKWGVINLDNEIIVPLKYDVINYFQRDDKLTTVKLDGKWGCIDKNGNVVIPIKYDKIDLFFQKGVINVELNGKKGKIDTKGNVVESFK